MEKQKIYDVHQLWMIYKSHRRWFLFSLLVCLCLGLAYIYWTKPAYRLSGDQARRRRADMSSRAK